LERNVSEHSQISVIIPAHNAAQHLPECLRSLSESSVAPLEVIVVDDGSTDGGRRIAEQFGARVLSTERRSGPAAARNLGARNARGGILFFLDADVCVHPDTIERVAEAFARDPQLDAVIGSYDDSPGCQDFLSQYKNLMHAFVHQTARQEAGTFWSGCGAIRKDVFLQFGGFDESYDRPAIEDIELGYRLRSGGRKIVLDRDIQVKHLKRWTFWGLVKTDILSRGIPWTELILRDRHMPNDLNVHLSQRVSVALTFVLSGMSLFAAFWWQGYFLVPLFAILFLVLGRYWVEHAHWKERKAGLLWTTGIVAAIVATAHFYAMDVLIPPLVLGYVLLLIRHRYEYDHTNRKIYFSALLAGMILWIVIFWMFYIPFHRFVFLVSLLLFAVVLLNTQFYLFLAEKKGGLFALAAIPFHLLYHFYNGISFAAGTVRFFFKTRRLPAARRVLDGHTAPSPSPDA
jgi:glycosyltransferase involved in cell wall biosynthesis